MTTGERWLWAGIAVVVAAIASSVAISGEAARSIAGSAWFDAAFSVGMLLFVVAAVMVGAARGVRVAQMGLAIGVAAAVTIASARAGAGAERSHLLEYGSLALLLGEALRLRGWPRPRFWAVVISVAVGAADELAQAFAPSRVFDWRDIGFDAIAAVAAITPGTLWAAARRRRGRSAPS